MIDRQELCQKIRSLHPALGRCGIDVDVNYDGDKQAWIVDLRKDQHRLQTHLEPSDADACMQGTQCVSLGVQIAQLVDNIEKRPD